MLILGPITASLILFAADDKPAPKSTDTVTSGPVKLTAKVSKKKPKPGDEIEFTVTAEVESGWHIYAVDKPTGVSIQTTLKLTPSKGVSAVGKWKIPEPTRDDKASEETYFYEGEAK